MVGFSLPRVYAIADAQVLAARGLGLREFTEELRAGGVRLVQYRNKVGSPQEVLRGAAVLREVFAGSGAVLIMNDRADLAVLAGFDGVHVGQGDLLPKDAKAVLAGRQRAAEGEADSSAALRNDKQENRQQQVGAGFSGELRNDKQGDGRRQTNAGSSAPLRNDKQENRQRQVGAGFLGALRKDEQEDGRGRGGVVGVSTHTDEQVRAAELSGADYVAIGPVFATGTKADAEAVVGLAGVRRARALTTKPLVAIGGITLANARSVIEAGADSVAVISALLSREVGTEALVRALMTELGADAVNGFGKVDEI